MCFLLELEMGPGTRRLRTTELQDLLKFVYITATTCTRNDRANYILFICVKRHTGLRSSPVRLLQAHPQHLHSSPQFVPGLRIAIRDKPREVLLVLVWKVSDSHGQDFLCPAFTRSSFYSTSDNSMKTHPPLFSYDSMIICFFINLTE